MRSISFVGVALLAVLSAGRLALAEDERPLDIDTKAIGGPNSGAILELWRPTGPGPFPAMIVMHDCDGVSSHQRSWAARLVDWGYAAAIVDSFRPRGVNSTCQGDGSPQPQLRAQDAL